MGGGQVAWDPPVHYYKDLGGWTDCTWCGVERLYFIFSDSLTHGGTIYAGGFEGYVATESCSELGVVLTQRGGGFAGIVCVENGGVSEA